MAIEFINEQHKTINYTESAHNLIKEYVLKNPTSAVGFKLKDLESKKALALFDFIGYETEARNQIYDYETIDSILEYKSLKGLFINEHSKPKPKVDLSSFPNLKLFHFDWNPKISNIGALHKLKQLYLFLYKPKSKDLTELSTLESLENLKLGSGNYETLKGLDKLKNLKVLRVYSNRFVKTDENVIIESVEELYIASCKSFDHNFYKSFPNLKILDIDSSIPIESLKPILDNLKNLESLNVYACNILEEDISYWKNYKNIKSLNFRNRRHFNLKTHDFENYPYDINGKKKGYTYE